MLGVGAEVAVQPRDAASDRDVDVQAGRGDGPGEVPAQPCVVGLVDQPEVVEEPGGDPEVDRIDRGLGDLAPDLSRPGSCSATGTSMISMESGPPGVRTTAARKVANMFAT